MATIRAMALALPALAALSALALWPETGPEPLPFQGPALPPPNSLRVLWVGHSLMNHRDPHGDPPENVLEVVGRFASERGLRYEPVDHTLFGSPLSLLWRGRPHSYRRDEPDMKRRREHIFASEAPPLDALVLTEGLPVSRSLEAEHSAYYLQAFRCAALKKNPQVRVYLYESWSHLEASDPDGDYPAPSTYDLLERLVADRAYYERVADLASTGRVGEPGAWARVGRLFGSAADCPPGPVYLVPVGAAFRKLGEELREHHWPSAGGRLTLRDLFANPRLQWPDGWPRPKALPPEQERRAIAALPLRHPGEDHDDIHPSRLGTYVAALVHFATLYGRPPEGLLASQSWLPEVTARRIEEIVWQVVVAEPRTGVEGRTP
jgi:hypothetical protein